MKKKNKDSHFQMRIESEEIVKHRQLGKQFGFSGLAEYIRFLLTYAEYGFSLSKTTEKAKKAASKVYPKDLEKHFLPRQ